MAAVSNGADFTKGTASSVSTQATASKTWVNGRRYLLFVASLIIGGSSVKCSTPVGWQLLKDGSATGTSDNHVCLFTWVGDGTTGTVTMDWGGVTQTYISWEVSEFQNTSVTATLATDFGTPVTADGNSTSPGCTLAAFTDVTNNAGFLAVYHHWQAALTAKASPAWTKLGDQSFSGEEACEWISGQDTSPSMTAGSADTWHVIGVEIKAATSGAGVVYNESVSDAVVATDAASIVQIIGGTNAENIMATDAYSYVWQRGPFYQDPSSGGGWRKWHQTRPGGSRPGSPRRPF